MTVILVHAAWADASHWGKVLLLLRSAGTKAIAVQLPLTSLSDDVAAVRGAVDRTPGPVVLVGHSYGGATITGVGPDRKQVRGLVYIAAMAPDEGETVGGLLHRAEAHPLAPALAPDEDGNLWMSERGFANAIAPESSEDEIFLMAATQKPTSIKCVSESMTAPAWKQKPCWFLLAERDRIIAPSTQAFMAQRAKAHVKSRDVDHSPAVSAPETVAQVIEEAVRALAGRVSGEPVHGLAHR
jgi:pimeloyl-ACP methyl ester carboxylesterase